MKNLLKSLFVVIAFAVTCSYAPAQHHDHHHAAEEPNGIVQPDGTLYGAEISSGKGILTIEEIFQNTGNFDGKVVIVQGEVKDVCQKAGCWMTFISGENVIRVRTGHEFLLPKDISGSNAVVEGRFKVVELEEDMANHYNAESLNPGKEVKGSVTALEIEATGIKIVNETDKMDTQPLLEIETAPAPQVK